MDDAEALMAFERERLAVLVAGDIERARRMHHPDFELITPRGVPLSREEYLDEIESGSLRYLSWEPEAMTVRMVPNAGVLRYRSRIEMESDGVRLPDIHVRHTDYYERTDGVWRIVLSQATAEH